MSEGEDPRRLPGGGETPVPPAPVQVQWPQTVAVIFNPSSGGDSARGRGVRIRQAIQETGKKLIWLETTPEDSGQGLAKDAVGQGADLVIATGGDGTVMACATALAGSEVPLAVLPLGTGNLVASDFDIPNDLDQAPSADRWRLITDRPVVADNAGKQDQNRTRSAGPIAHPAMCHPRLPGSGAEFVMHHAGYPM